MDRWFHHIDILVGVVLLAYTSVGVAAGYLQNVTGLFLIFFVQGSIETWLQTGKSRK